MIEAEEIENKAKEFEIHSSNVQRDYVFGWFLFGIFTISNLKDSIFLKGGNALRKGYFENTRFSADLDFGIPTDIDQNSLLEEINKICDFIEEKAKVSFIKEENIIKEKFTAGTPIPNLHVYEARIYFKDFYGKADYIHIKISMDITRFDETILPITKVKLIHPYSDKENVDCEIRCMKLEEIIATKLKCLMQRQHPPDLFDYVYSIKLLGGELNKKEIAETFIKKTIFQRNPYVVKKILKETPFDFFKEYWEKTIVCAKQAIFGVEEAIEFFISNMEEIFGTYNDNGFVQFIYFGPELRVPIMKAGRTQTLLKIKYKGYERLVEPYSIKYLQARDGNEKEYFFAYDQIGGSSGPGIKMFVPENVESIENTEEKFELRYPIEISKAGERPENPYLFDPNKPTSSPRRSRLSIGPKYVYQCNYCGKKFMKRTNNGNLNPHKDKNGYLCGGKYGHYVDTRY